MAKRKSKNNQAALLWVVLLVVVAVGVYFLFFVKRAECIVDSDCAAGQTCSMGISGSVAKCMVPTAPSGSAKDNICDSTKSISWQMTDPDCPLYCPLTGRAGSSGFCCLNANSTATIDCTTGAILYPANFANLQAFVTFGIQGGSNTTKTLTNVGNTVSWTAQAVYPQGVSTLSLWMANVTLSPANAAFLWTDANCTRNPPTAAGCLGKANAFTGVTPGNSGTWTAAPFNMDNLPDGTYTVTYTYCVQDAAGTIILSPICNTLTYNMLKQSTSLAFNVAVTIGS